MYLMIKESVPSTEYLEYIKAYKDLHKQQTKFLGNSLNAYIIDIAKLILDYKCKTLLDYGCGKGLPYSDKHEKVGIKYPLQKIWKLDSHTLYDPAYPKYNTLPTGTYDIVVCTDVLEHIPEQDLDWVITRLIKYTKKVLFLNICTVPALKHFKKGKLRGKNLHISVFDIHWWNKKFQKHWESNKDINIYLTLSEEKDTTFICYKK